MTEHLSCKTVKIMKMFSKGYPLIRSNMGVLSYRSRLLFFLV